MDLSKEEERIMKRRIPTGGLAGTAAPAAAGAAQQVVKTRAVVEAPKVAIRSPSGKVDRVRVDLVTPSNHAVVLWSLEVELNKGRLPMRRLMDEWRLRKPVWIDADLPVGLHPDGFSDVEFVGIDKVRLVDEASN
jgi:hypothetical protein